MQINIHAPFAVNDGLKTLINEKLDKLNTFYGRILKADVHLRLKISNVPNGKTVEINLHLPIKDTSEKAVANKLEKQLKKCKEILAKKH